MLEPNSRTLLLDALRPPAGYELSAAFGTTYTLDLVALMVAALPFTFFDTEDGEGENVLEPLPLIEALRRNADRITLFCQAGKISVPKNQRPLFAYVEDCVYEALPSRGAFHPKVWVLRYTAENKATRYRLLCLSRNLTFDRSWDTVLVLDGELIDRQNGFSANRPLSDFVTEVANMATRPLSPDRASQIRTIADECRRVRWETPLGFSPDVGFWPLGIPGYSSRNMIGTGWRQLLVVSPFLTQDTVADLASRARIPIIISRTSSLNDMPAEKLEPYAEMYVLNDAAEAEPSDSGAPSDALENERPMAGLHAKLYVMHNGQGRVRILTGSANATHAGMSGNVEFMVELDADRSMRIEKLLEFGETGATSLRDMLLEYEPTDTTEDTDSDVEKRLDALLDEAEYCVAGWPIGARVVADDASDAFRLELHTEAPLASPGARVTVSPLAPNMTGVELNAAMSGRLGVWGPMDIETLSAFFTFELKATVESRSSSRSFVRRLPLTGEPPGRRESILRSILRDRGNVLRYLMLLASLDGAAPGSSLARARDLGERGDSGLAGLEDYGPTLFESLVRALDREPKRLSQVNRLVSDLRADPKSAALLPEGFDTIWDPIWAHAQTLLDPEADK
ncbi:MAG: hypothetical protein HGB10_04045 [Coriobacteriia bacterium]|nr:hypothetical protein [Coriobacteriia bacterium]